MHINNPDALKIWLTVVLEPLCDADPSALARYVLALLKKEKPVKDLMQTMNEQLDVFLGTETKPFLARLFEVIKTEEYLSAPSMETNSPVNAPSNASSSEQVIGNESVASTQEISNAESDASRPSLLSASKEASQHTDASMTATTASSATANTTTDNESDLSPLEKSITKLREVSPVNKSDSDKELRRRISLRRSRSRSRSRSRRTGERDRTRPYYRNKSPPATESERDRERERERSRKDNPFRRGIHDKSPKKQSGFRSHSNERNHEDGVDHPNTRSISPGPNKGRCRDFDEKGYCMRGETCPWDHGVNPVVLEDINSPTLMSISGTPHMRGGEYNPDAPELWIRGGNFTNGTSRAATNTGIVPAPAGQQNAYPRLPVGGAVATGFRAGPPFPFPLNANATTPLQRELISVPVVEANQGGDISAASAAQKRRYEPEDSVAIAEGPPKRKPVGSRLGPPARIAVQQNCSLELRKVPRGLNSIAHLNNHFCKFGKIVNIQVSYEGDPEAAIVTFSTHAEANVAYRSTEAVLNNRFIKVFWHMPAAGGGNSGMLDGNHNSTAGVGSNGAPKEEAAIIGSNLRKYSIHNVVPANTPVPANPVSATTATDATSATTAATGTAPSFSKTNTVAGAQAAAAAANRQHKRINRAAPTEAIRKKKEEQVKAAVQLAHGLHKRKHELLQGYLRQMRQCVEVVERLDSTDPQRPGMLQTVHTLQSNIDNLNKEIAAEQAKIAAQIQNNAGAPTQPPHPFRKSKEMAKKELLDIELELIAQQQEGNDTTAIQKRIEELQKILGVSKPPFARVVRARPPPGSTSFDRRPTTVLVSGFDAADCDAILGHFKHYGEITKNDIEKTIPCIRVTYATRLNAEQAMLRGRRFKEKQLQISWFVQQSPEAPKITANEDELLDDTNLDDSLPSEIRLEDEEDDEETEDRSWRR